MLIVRRVEALGKFLDTDDGKNLLAGTKRAANILRIEEKKDSTAYTGAPDAALLASAEEKALAARHRRRQDRGRPPPSRKEDFAAAMTAMAKLRPHVDAFFDKVTVNVDDKAVRENRLQAAQRDPRGDPRGGGFLQDRRARCSSVMRRLLVPGRSTPLASSSIARSMVRGQAPAMTSAQCRRLTR